MRLIVDFPVMTRLRVHGRLPPLPGKLSLRYGSSSSGTAPYLSPPTVKYEQLEHATLNVVKILLYVCAVCNVMWKPRKSTFAFSWIPIFRNSIPPALRKQPPSGVGTQVLRTYAYRGSIRKVILHWYIMYFGIFIHRP